jgi:hypothetical protein
MHRPSKNDPDLSSRKSNGGQYIEVQKGPVRCQETDSLAFPARDPTARDMEMLAMRRDGMSLKLHEPKR